ncbi:MAG: copper ion binding protein [Akkermansiaceae bacterium]|nr:copper ion binding protein [Akkermansiaceae bacterium]
MKSILLATLTFALAGFAPAQDGDPKPAPKPPECKFCDLPAGRAALLAGKKECPEGCEKLCCTGTNATYVVTGMTCPACSGKVEAALAKLDGVKVDAVDHKSGRAVVKYDPATAQPKDIMAAINATGFKVSGEQLTFAVTGMTCGGCAGKLDAVLAKTEGVTAVDKVCHESGCATVTIDPAKTDQAKVEAAINATGFKVPKDD